MTQDKIWAYFQNEGVAVFEHALPRYHFLAKRLSRRLRAPASMLNIGVGSGTLERILLEQGYRVTALDPDERSVRRLVGAGIDARVGAAEKLPFSDNAFDAVVASEVLEHLSTAESREAVSHIWRTLKAGGLFFGTVPYREDLANNTVMCPNCGHGFHRWGHQQSFDKHALIDLLRERFEVLLISRRSFVPWTCEPVRFMKSTLKWLLGRAGQPIASPHFYFECRKRPR